MMKRYSIQFLLFAALVILGLGNARAQGTVTTYTVSPINIPYNFTVPYGATSMTVDLKGARGGYATTTNAPPAGDGTHGSGGEVIATMAVTGGQSFIVYVGAPGQASAGSSSNNTTANFGGYNGGATGYGLGAGGGGASDIRQGGSALSNRIIVAGGGGGWGGVSGVGGAPYSAGGCGGGLTGQTGYWTTSGTNPTNSGSGGTQAAGGAKASSGQASDQADGAFGIGGQGSSNTSGNQDYGGGGGGGWYGGGGGVFGGGGGGSNYIAPSIWTGTSNIQCANDGPGTVIIYTDCNPAVAGQATGPAAVCAGSGTVTFSNPTGSGGGTWTSNNIAISFPNPNVPVANVIGSVSSATSVLITNNIQYGCGPNAPSSYTITVNPLPQPIVTSSFSAPGAICSGSTQLVQSTTLNGTWTSGNTNIVTAVALPSSTSFATITGIAAGTSVITYTLPTTCATTYTQTINPLPASITTTAPALVCQNTGSYAFSDATSGGTWSTTATYNVNSSGVVNSINSGAGSVVYTIGNSNGVSCSVSKQFTVEALPTNIPMDPGGTVTRCSNGDGVALDVPYTDNLVKYVLYRNGIQFAPAATGNGNQLNFGKVTAAGTYSVVATSPNGCVTNMTGTTTIVVNTAPKISTFHADGPVSFCASPGSGVNLLVDTVDLVDPGVYYSAFRNGNAEGSPGTPTAGVVSLGLFSNPGIYTIVASDGNGCNTTLKGSITITPEPLPQVNNITGGGNYCAGGPGVAVCMDNTVVGVDYGVYVNDGVHPTTLVDTKAGTGSTLCFGPAGVGLLKNVGTYSVLETNRSTGCFTSAAFASPITVGIYTPPAADTLEGGKSICANDVNGAPLDLRSSKTGVNYQLYNSGVATGSPLAGTGAMLPLGAQYTNGVFTVIGTDATTHCATNMIGAASVVLIAIPPVQPVTGGGAYCLGVTNPNPVVMGNETPGIQYTRIRNGVPVGFPISYPQFTFADTLTGNFTVQAYDPINLCYNTMSGSATVAVNTLPKVYPISGGGNYCVGNGGKNINMAQTGLGINYQLFYIDGTPASGLIAGSNAGIDFGSYTTTGDYYAMATNAVTGCTDTMRDTLTITSSAKPNVYAVTGSGSSYCFGDPGIDIMLSSSQSGVRYQFYRAGLVAAPPVNGTGLTLDFGMQTLPGAYSVSATDTTTGCADTMFGKAVVVINALPSVYVVGGGGSYCSGDTGVHVTLSRSDAGINYQLYNSGMPTGITKAGTGAMLDFGAQTAPGNYTVMAVNAGTTCVNSMAGTVTISINVLPNQYPVTGGGAICAGASGNNIAVGGSEAGVSYRLYKNDTAIDLAIAGSGSPVNFGIHSAGGVYNIIGTRTATGCKSAMSNTTTINVNALPSAFTLSGASVSCKGATTVHITNSGSVIGVNYQLVNGTTPIGMYVTGNGHSLDFGIPDTTGSFDVVATDALTGCTNKTIAPVSVVINQLPGLQTMTGGGHYCIAKSGAKIGLAMSDAGINYQLYMGTTSVGPLMPGGGYMVDFGYQKTAGTYTVMGINATTGCMQKMTGSEDVIVDALTPAGVTISTVMSGDTVCAGATYAFTAMPVNGGSAPVYSWSVNGGPAIAYGPSYTYVPVNGDILGVTMTSNADCAVPPTVSYSKIITTVPYIMPAATLTADHGDHICAGTKVMFTAAPTADGYAQNYNWVINGKIDNTLHGMKSITYAPADNDIVTFMLGSSYPCKLSDTVFSNVYRMSVDPGKTPVVTLTASQGTKLAAGQSDTFMAAATNVGTAPAYQWYENGATLAGETSNRFISNQFFDGDSVTCVVTSSGACGMMGRNSMVINIVKSAGINGTANANADIRVIPNPSKGDFVIKGSLGVQTNEQVSLEITNMLGQVVYSQNTTATNGTIDQRVSLGDRMATGMYLLTVRGESGSNVYHIVVEQK